jgi:hypothetical protein
MDLDSSDGKAPDIIKNNEVVVRTFRIKKSSMLW